MPILSEAFNGLFLCDSSKSMILQVARLFLNMDRDYLHCNQRKGMSLPPKYNHANRSTKQVRETPVAGIMII